ncbi:unnamed protein product, partial [Iphiclides podalirius]
MPLETLPANIYSDTASLADSIVKETKSLIEDAIALELEGIRHINADSQDKPEEQVKENIETKNIIKQVNRVICNKLADKIPHILSAQTDYEPRHEAFWFVGGINVPYNVVKWRKQYKWLKDRLLEPIDRPVQYTGTPVLSIRSHLPLQPILPYEEATNPEFKVPKFSYFPETVGYNTQFRHGTNIPGFWPGDHDEFGLMSYHSRDHIVSRKKSFGPEDNLDALHSSSTRCGSVAVRNRTPC